MSKRERILAAVSAVMALVLVISGLGLLVVHLNLAANWRQSPAVAPTDTPYAAATLAIYPTPTLVLVQGAVLGGTDDDFTATFGSPLTSQDGTVDTYDFSVGGQIAQLTISVGTNATTGTDYLPRVGLLEIWVNGVTEDPTAWLNSDAGNFYGRFLPLDSILQGSTSDGSDNLSRKYLSSLLATTFPAADFQDARTGDNTPGTFAVRCEVLGNLGRCSMSLSDLLY